MSAQRVAGSLLFLGPLPEPTTGHSLACQVLYEHLRKSWRVEVINLNKATFRQGVSSVGRIYEVSRIIWRAWRHRNCASLYFTVSQSVAGNLKDLAIYAVCFRHLRRMTIHLHGGAGLRRLLAHPSFLSRLNQYFLRRLGAVIVLGERHLPIFTGIVARERLHVVYNFSPDEMFLEHEQVAGKFSNLHPLRVLFLSNLLPGKGHDELLEAFFLLEPAEQSRIRLDFAGGFATPEQEADFRARASHGSIRVLGTVKGEQKQSLFAAAHVFCLPTYYPYEGQPISILEAYASGCAVITTDHSGIFDIFADGRNGYAVEAKSPLSIAEALRRALREGQQLLRFGEHNALEARNKYRAADHVAAISALLMQVSEQSESGGSMLAQL